MKNEEQNLNEAQTSNSIKADVTCCKFLVDRIRRNDGFDIFIIGWDDFKARKFDNENEALQWIDSFDEGEYTITKIYCR
jgi:hypothetical protein